MDPIKFLLDRKFGASVVASGRLVTLSAERQATLYPELAERIAKYKGHLQTLSPEELKVLLESEQEKYQAELSAIPEQQERSRFYNQPYAQADFDYWSTAAHWTLDEAVALSFGKAPEHVTWEKIKSIMAISPFATQFHRRRDLALRAGTLEQWSDPVLPGIFLAWAKRIKLEYPPELEAAVSTYGVQVADWKTLFEKLKADTDELQRRWSVLCKEKDQLNEQLSARIAELEAQLASAADAVVTPDQEKISRHQGTGQPAQTGHRHGGRILPL